MRLPRHIVITGLIAGWLVASVLPSVARGAHEPMSLDDQFDALISEGQPTEGMNAANGLMALAAWVRQIASKVAAERFPTFDPDEFSIASLNDHREAPEDIMIIRAVLERLVAEGLDERLAEVASSPRWIRGVGGEAVDLMPEREVTKDIRFIGRLIQARMILAEERQDWTAWARILDQGLAIAALAGRDVEAIVNLTASAVESLIIAGPFARGSASDIRTLDDGTLARLDASLRAHRVPSLARSLRADRLTALMYVELIFERGPAMIEWIEEGGRGPLPPVPAEPPFSADDPLARGWPTLDGVREEVNTFYAEALRRLDLTIPALDALPPMSEYSKRSKFLTLGKKSAVVIGPFPRTLRAGWRTMLALERYQRDHQKYPESLAELVPTYIEDVTDPGTGKPLGYLPPSKGPYEGGRAYVLYSSGPDGDDDGGAVNFADPYQVNRDGRDHSGDFLLNQ